MGSAWSRKQASIDASFAAAPRDVGAWDLQHIKMIHAKFRDDGYEFGMNRTSLRDLLTSALPPARALTGDFWDTYVSQDQELLYPLELFAALALQCQGLSRDKAGFFFDMFDFGGQEEASYDEVAICISTVVGALSKVSSLCRLLDEEHVDKLADNAYVVAERDTSAPLTKAQFLAWIEKGLKIDLSADVSIEDAGTALGVLFEQVGKKGDQKEEKKPGEATTQEHRAVEAEGKDVAKMRDEQG